LDGSANDHDDRDRFSGCHSGSSRLREMSDEDIDTKSHQFCCKLSGLIASSVSIANLKRDVLPFAIT
jgi:hypothetical protein